MNFSVLLSLYIKEKPEFLRECLESLKNQTLPATEIVMVFDGAITPELETTVVEYTTVLPLKIIRLPKNVGMGNAFNEGLKHCSYEWVFRMDTDDICIPERFEKQVSFIKEHPNVILFGSHIAEFNNNINEVVSYRNVPISNKAIRNFSLFRTPFNHMTVAYKRDIAIEVGGYRAYLLEDYNLWLRIIAKGYEVVTKEDLPEKFDTDTTVDQNVTIHLKHKTEAVKEEKKVSLTVRYHGAGDKTPPNHVEKAVWTRTVTKNKVTGEIIDNGTWISDKSKYAEVTSPVIEGYTADILVVAAETVTQDNIVKDVNYTAKPQKPSNPETPGNPDPKTPENPSGNKDKQKVLSVKAQLESKRGK